MPKTRVEKQALLSKYKEVVDRSNFTIVEINNVPANVLTSLRKKLSDIDGQFMVIKTNIFKRATEGEKAADGTTYEGPLAVLEGGSDIVTALKAFDTAAKEAKAALSLMGADEKAISSYVPFTFRMSVINHSFLTGEDTVRLSKLPDKKTVLAQFVGTLAAPISGAMNVMNGVSRNLVYALTDLKDKKAAQA